MHQPASSAERLQLFASCLLIFAPAARVFVACRQQVQGRGVQCAHRRQRQLLPGRILYHLYGHHNCVRSSSTSAADRLLRYLTCLRSGTYTAKRRAKRRSRDHPAVSEASICSAHAVRAARLPGLGSHSAVSSAGGSSAQMRLVSSALHTVPAPFASIDSHAGKCCNSCAGCLASLRSQQALSGAAGSAGKDAGASAAGNKGVQDMLNSKEFVRYLCDIFNKSDQAVRARECMLLCALLRCFCVEYGCLHVPRASSQIDADLREFVGRFCSLVWQAHGYAVRVLWCLFRGIYSKSEAAEQ
jgi:hypothetical protein